MIHFERECPFWKRILAITNCFKCHSMSIINRSQSIAIWLRWRSQRYCVSETLCQRDRLPFNACIMHVSMWKRGIVLVSFGKTYSLNILTTQWILSTGCTRTIVLPSIAERYESLESPSKLETKRCTIGKVQTDVLVPKIEDNQMAASLGRPSEHRQSDQ